MTAKPKINICDAFVHVHMYTCTYTCTSDLLTDNYRGLYSCTLHLCGLLAGDFNLAVW